MEEKPDPTQGEKKGGKMTSGTHHFEESMR
jgi:hypothetical protein